MKRVFVFVIVVFAFGIILVLPSSVFAAEGGIGHYVPGAMADFGDMAPPSGFALMSWYNNYSGSVGASKQLPKGGLIAAKLRATSDAEMVGAV